MTNHTIGVDISKDHLDAFLLPEGTVQRFTNDRAGLRAFCKWLAPLSVERIVYEPTGAYHRAFEDTLAVAGLALAKVNPLQARRFAQACGTRAKTDKVDARMLAAMGAALRPDITPTPSGLMRTFKQLQLASLAGLAPYSCESGKWKGKRFIGGGRKFLRDALYMPALVACRFNPDLAET